MITHKPIAGDRVRITAGSFRGQLGVVEGRIGPLYRVRIADRILQLPVTAIRLEAQA